MQKHGVKETRQKKKIYCYLTHGIFKDSLTQSKFQKSKLVLQRRAKLFSGKI